MKSTSNIILSMVLFAFLAACSSHATRKVDQPNPTANNTDHSLPEVAFCVVPDPSIPSSAFNITHSESDGKAGYWVNYECKQSCENWRECLVPAYSDDNGILLTNGRDEELPKQSLAFIVDGMGGHLALSSDGEKTVFIHTGAGGTRYYSDPAFSLEQMSNANTVMMRWEKGYTSPLTQPPFPGLVSWGWYSRTSAEPTNIKELNKRVASMMSWTHENLSDSNMYGTLGCSMGTNATFGPVLWHGLDPVVDYQLFVGGPNMWDLNAQCGRRVYEQGHCDSDAVTSCTENGDCAGLGGSGICLKPDEYTTIDILFEQFPNHIHVADACDIKENLKNPIPYPPFDESSMAFASGADWEIDHHMDFLINTGAAQGQTMADIGGDELWGGGHFPSIFNKIQPEENREWHIYPGTHHCSATFKEALDVIKERMDL
jgi:hypothetical protein